MKGDPDNLREKNEADAASFPRHELIDLTDSEGNSEMQLVTLHASRNTLPAEIIAQIESEERELQAKLDGARSRGYAAMEAAMWDFHCLEPEPINAWIVTVEKYENGFCISNYIAHVASTAQKAFAWIDADLNSDDSLLEEDHECYQICGEMIDGDLLHSIGHFGVIRRDGRFTLDRPNLVTEEN